MEIREDYARKLMKAVGYNAADNWKLNKLEEKVNQLASAAGDINQPEDSADELLLSKVLSALEEDDTITINPVEKDEEMNTTETKAPAKVKKAAKDKAAKADKGRGASTVKAKKTLNEGARKVGIVDAIVECLKNAGPKKPVTKANILEYLQEKFPDRNPESMKSTIQSQVPSRIKVDKELNVQKNEKGYWIGK